MSAPVIRVDRLAKRYTLTQGLRYRTLREVVADAARRVTKRRATRERAADFWALRDVSFDIRAGEVVGVIGDNGAGKSTLLKILCRITLPTEGRVELTGRVASLLEVGTGFHPELSGRENIYLNGAILGMRRREIDRNLDDIAAFAGVIEFLDTPVKRYSSGMYVRLAFAVAAHLESEILLIDEVLAVGDVAFQRKCIGKMEELSAASGRTLIFVSHNMVAVRNLCSRCIWLESGRVRGIGPAAEVVDEYVRHSLHLEHPGDRDLRGPDVRRGAKKAVLGQMRFRRIGLRGKNQTLAVFKEGDPIKIDLEFQSSIASDNVEVLILVLTVDGTVLFTGYSGPLSRIHEGTSHVEARIDPNPLQAGTYRIRLYLRAGDWQDVIPDAINFRVEVGEEQFGGLYSHPGLRGIIRASFDWSAPHAIPDVHDRSASDQRRP